MRSVLNFLTLASMAATEATAGEEKPRVQVVTTIGDFTIELYPDRAPISVANFLRYVDEEFYHSTTFHRIINDFIIQGGGFTTDKTRKDTHDPIKNEADNGLKNVRGAVAMARVKEVDSATSQFFVNLSDNPSLDHSENDFGYAVFGHVVEGMESAVKISGVPTVKHGPHRDQPRVNVVLKRAVRV
ncbi:MAG: peptidylprolyl isomerase [Nitrococcus sp.]|nr:peptidylprolyl isomerase [Nitrococcus sp.]